MLHIHNGDASADTARKTDLPGEHFAFRESLITGPTPADLDPPDWRQVRARHLSESYDVEIETCERQLLEQERKLAAISNHDEVILWFEHDLFCQVHLIYLLSTIAQHATSTKLSLICINEFEGKPKFRGLGELDSDQLASLFPRRQPVTPTQLQIASSAWAAFTSPNPEAIEKFLESNSGALPFLAQALRAHLRRFPATANGLGAIEKCGLELIRNGLTAFGGMFGAFVDAEPIFGLGDAQFWLALKRMADARTPLITINRPTTNTDNIVDHNASFSLTQVGDAVLRGNADFVDLNEIDLWLGGVHLSGDAAAWRWDPNAEKLMVS
jgi:hypothetical protein